MAGKSSSQAAGTNDAGLEPWRRLFDGVDIFNVITHAILVVAIDSPQEFLRRRGSIVEQIYSAPAVVPVPGTAAAGGEGPSGASRRVSADNAGNNNVATTSSAGAYAEVGVVSDLFKLHDEMKEASLENEEVLCTKDILLNHHEQAPPSHLSLTHA